MVAEVLARPVSGSRGRHASADHGAPDRTAAVGHHTIALEAGVAPCPPGRPHDRAAVDPGVDSPMKRSCFVDLVDGPPPGFRSVPGRAATAQGPSGDLSPVQPPLVHCVTVTQYR